MPLPEFTQQEVESCQEPRLLTQHKLSPLPLGYLVIAVTTPRGLHCPHLLQVRKRVSEASHDQSDQLWRANGNGALALSQALATTHAVRERAWEAPCLGVAPCQPCQRGSLQKANQC